MYKVNGSVWIQSSKGTFIGIGRIALLERIIEYGSITMAAKSMKMSYRHAWELINSMNSQAKKPLVITASGGAGGGGTKITKEGEKVIKIFKSLQKRFYEFNEDESRKIEF